MHFEEIRRCLDRDGVSMAYSDASGKRLFATIWGWVGKREVAAVKGSMGGL